MMTSFSSVTRSGWHSAPHEPCTQCRGHNIWLMGDTPSGESSVRELKTGGLTASSGGWSACKGNEAGPGPSSPKHSANEQCSCGCQSSDTATASH